MRGKPGPLDDLVERQLAIFAADEADLLEEAVEAEAAWNDATRDAAEEAYGDYQLVVDAIADRLLEAREAYALTLTEDMAETYREAYAKGVRTRFRRYGTILADLDADA